MQEITLTEAIAFTVTVIICAKLAYDFYKSDKEDQAYIKRIRNSTC